MHRKILSTPVSSVFVLCGTFSSPALVIYLYHLVEIPHGASEETTPIFLSHQRAVRLHYRYTAFLSDLNGTWNDSIESWDDEYSLDPTNRACVV